MKSTSKKSSLIICFLLMLSALTPVLLAAQDSSLPSTEYVITVDNDVFIAYRSIDKDYSFGLLGELRFKGDSTKSIFFKKKVKSILYGFKVGIMGWTPEHDAEDFDPSNIVGRPFAAWLAISHNQYYVFDQSYLRLGLQAGVIGPKAYGGNFQNWFHREFDAGPHVQGWENQIPGHFGININGEFLRTYTRKNNFMLYGQHAASLGNVLINLEPSLVLRWGRFSSLKNFSRLTDSGVKGKKVSCFVDLRGGISYRMYDATLQGNLFKNKDFYTSQSINNSALVSSIKGSVMTKRWAVSMQFHYRAADLGSSDRFSYGSLDLAFTL